MKFTNISIAFILSTVTVIMSSATSVVADDDVHLSSSSSVPRRLGGFGGRDQQGSHGGDGGGKGQGFGGGFGGRGQQGSHNGDDGVKGQGFGGDRDHGGHHDLFHPDEEDKESFCMNFNCTKAEESFPTDNINCTKPDMPDIDLEELKMEEPEKYNHLGCRCCNDDDEGDEDDEEDEASMMSRGQNQHGGRSGPHGGHRGRKSKHICAMANFSCPAFLDEPDTNCTKPEFYEDFGFDDKGEEGVVIPGPPPPPKHHHAYCMCCTGDNEIGVDGTFNMVTANLENSDITSSGSASWANISNNLMTSTTLVGSLLVAVCTLMM